MTLWEREALEGAEAEAARVARVAELDKQRAEQEAEAQERLKAYKKAEEEREERLRLERLADLEEKSQREAEFERAGKQALEDANRAMQEEQDALNKERERQEALRLAREKPPEIIKTEDFAYNLQDGMGAKVKKFRQRGTGGDALIIKIEHDLNELQIEHEMTGISVEDVAEHLDVEPRYVLYIHKVAHRDGRVQYPICFIVYMPENIPVTLKVMYTRPIVVLCDTFKVNKHFPLEDGDDLDDEWVMRHLGM